MSENTKIQWCHHTYNPWRGCRKVAPECENCYITTTVPFRTTGQTHGSVRVRAGAATLREPHHWNAKAAKAGIREFVFCLSLGDWLDDENVPVEWLADLLKTIYETPNLTWLLLTKRPKNFSERLSAAYNHITDYPHDIDFACWIFTWRYETNPPSNVFIGVSLGADQSAALDIPARVHFLSCEPMLGPLICPWLKEFDLVIFGGESGKNARPCNVDWIYDGIKKCIQAGAGIFVKQLGAHVIDKTITTMTRWPISMPIEGNRVFLRDKKGGDISEWPSNLNIRNSWEDVTP